MEARRNKYRQVSPERAKVWKERSPKNRKVAVVYYLCRNRQLEHPHFIEVPLSSPHGLYLRDVIQRLNVLRGRGMASMYSWSSKRSYKNGFVWHDLSEDNLILPAHGNEYVLKGSELFEDSTSDRYAVVATTTMQNLKQLPEPSSSRSRDDSSSSSSSLFGKETKHSQEDEVSPPPPHNASSSSISPESRDGKSCSWNGSLGLTEYKVYRSEGVADVSTQTEDHISRPASKETCIRGVSTDDGSLEHECDVKSQTQEPHVNEYSQMGDNSVSPPPSTSSASSSSGGKIETLESLIRADVNKINSFRILEEEDVRMSTNPRLKATNMLMQLISCGSVSVKDHSFGLIRTYKPRFSHSKYGSPFFPTSIMLRELDCISENPRLMNLRLENKKYFSGSLIETKMCKEEGGQSGLKRSSSYNADRSLKELDPSKDNGESTSAAGSKCISLAMKASLSKHPLPESTRNSPEGAAINIPGKRVGEPAPGRKQSETVDTFREEKQNVIQIEERLASGARVIIQSQAAAVR